MTARRHAALALLLFLGCALLVMGPNLPRFADAAVGDPDSDALKHVWGQWWIHQRVTEDLVFPLEMDIANYPDRGKFFCLDSANALLAVPLRLLVGPVTTYNLLLLLHLALAGWAAYLLAREVTGQRDAAVVAGAVYGFSPYVLSFSLGSGVAETAFLFPLPLVVLFGLRTLRQPGWTNPVITAALLLGQGFASWSYGIYATLLLTFLAAALMLARGRARLAGAAEEGAGLWAGARVDRRLAGRLALMVAALLPAALLYAAVADTTTGDGAMYRRALSIWPREPLSLAPRPLPPGMPLYNAFSWIDYLLPGQGGLHTLVFIDKLTCTAYCGYAALLLGLFAVLRRARGRATFAVAAGLFFVFSLGPLLYTGHERLVPAPTNWLFMLFHRAFPLFNATIHSLERFAVGFQLALAVIAAGGLGLLVRRLAPRWRRLACLGAVGLVLAEYLLLSPAPWPLPASPAVAHAVSLQIADDGPGGVIDLPPYQGRTHLFSGDIFFQQTVHGRPIPYNLEGVSPTVGRNPFFQRAEALRTGGQPQGPPCVGIRRLRQSGFTHLLLRPARLEPSAAEALRRMLDGCLGRGQRLQGVVVYSLEQTRPR